MHEVSANYETSRSVDFDIRLPVLIKSMPSKGMKTSQEGPILEGQERRRKG